MIQQLRLVGGRLPRRRRLRPARPFARPQGRQRPARADAARQSSATIHDAYFEAGADIVETNTFNATRDRAGRLRPRGSRARDQPRRGVDRARVAPTLDGAGRRTGRASSPARSGRRTAPRRSRRTSTIPGARNVTYDELVAAYREAAEGLIEGGADLLLVETVFDTLNAKAALFGIEEAFDARGRTAAADRVGNDHRRVGTHAVRADADGVLALGAPRASRSPSASTARSARR